MSSKYHIKNGTVVSIDPSIGVVRSCDVIVEDHKIIAVGADLSSKSSSDHIVIDATNAIISPGFVDTHRHAWQTQLRTVCSDHVIGDYFLHIRNIYGSCYTAHDAYMGNYCGALESIDNGITFMVDHSHIMNSPEHADFAVAGLRDSKIRAIWCYGLYKNPAWPDSAMDFDLESKTPEWRFDDAKRVRENLFPVAQQPTDLLRFGFAPAEMDFYSFEEVEKELLFGRALDPALITGHVAIGLWDGDRKLIRQLNSKNLLGPDLLFSHGTTLQPDEIEACCKHSVALSSTPDTELQMGMGWPIAFEAQKHGCTASLGIDVTSNNPADMFQQMRLLLQAERYKQDHATPGPPLQVSRRCADVLEMATMGGAKAVGLADIVGSITPDKRADLIITRCDSTRMTPILDPVAALVLYANASDVDTVLVDGEIVKQGGKLVGVDWPKVRNELNLSAQSIFEKSKKAPFEEIKNGVMAAVKESTKTNGTDRL